ncbi:hypothetical protein DV735_g2545, partial [Chaetothyriales sp. CBS 134920]
MASKDGASSISVVVRVRPFTIREAAQLTKADDTTLFLGDGSLAAAPAPKLSQKGIRSVIKVVDDRCLVFDPPEDNPVQKFSRSVVPMGKKVKDQTFGFDRIFDENATQDDVYVETAKPLLDSVLDGYNATVFAYGATGCGKTHTITGTAQQPGIIFLTMQELFDRIGECQEEKVTEISLSYLEIYNETIRDLLVPSETKAGLMLREDSHQAVSVAGLSSHTPRNANEVMEMIILGNERRSMSPTEANATSSRSHAVLQINVAQKDRNASVEEPHTMATLSIIDLAGSERASATKNRGVRLMEGANINKSLLALGSCINALCDPRKKNHVPYRNSKLTRLLKFSLGGNCKTVMIVCVSPSSQHFDETQNTLRYANRAKNIQTKVTRNVYNVNRHVKDFLVKIDEQMALINELKAQQKDYESRAFAKFRKQTEKREAIARDGLIRIRSAYEHSAGERQERTNNMIKVRQINRRIAMLSSWIAAFDAVVDNTEADEPLKKMQAVRKTAQGILIELETARHHCQQKVTKSNWDRALTSALDAGLRQLKEVDIGDALDSETLSREVELLKANAEREALAAAAEQDKLGEASTTQVLVHAHFETIAAIEKLNSMSVDEAVDAATEILGRMLSSASKAVSYVVKPDGSLAPVEAFAPRKAGTPKRRKHATNASLLDASPVAPAKATAMLAPPPLPVSPIKVSPRRRALVGNGKKAVSFTPKKRVAKGVKRVVRWRDDTEDGILAEFAKTPQKEASSSPDESTCEMTVPELDSRSANRRSPTPLGMGSPDGCNISISSGGSSDTENHVPNKDEARRIGAARRSSSLRQSGAARARRRRSPNSASSSPPPEPLFAAGHVRRMVNGKTEKENDWRLRVLSPRVQGVISQGKIVSSGPRRTTLGEGVRSVSRDANMGVGERASMRLSATAGGTWPRPPIAALFVVVFDHRKGYVLQWHRSLANTPVEGVVEFKSLPSGLHRVDDDVVYFVHANYAGVSAFVNRPDPAAQRDARMLAVGVLVPLHHHARMRMGKSWLHAERLRALAIEQINAHQAGSTSTSTSSDGYQPNNRRVMSALSVLIPDAAAAHPLPPHHPAAALLEMVTLFGPLIFPLYRAALLRKRILLLTDAPVESACNMVYNLSVLSSLPKPLLAYLPGAGTAAAAAAAAPSSLLRPVPTLFNIGITDIDDLSPRSAFPDGWIACTTDEVLATKPQLYDIAVYLPNTDSSRTGQKKIYPRIVLSSGEDVAKQQLPQTRSNPSRNAIGGDEDDDETLIFTPDDIRLMGLDAWSRNDSDFVEELLRVWWRRNATVKSARVECCGLRIL